jgi:PilZ domain
VVNKVISMQERTGNPPHRLAGIRDRRYTIRYPFAADVKLIDLETGKQVDGVTSDISLGGCFVCASKSLAVNARARMNLSCQGQSLEALVIVRIVKPRVGMGIEFFDLEGSSDKILTSWIATLRRVR